MKPLYFDVIIGVILLLYAIIGAKKGLLDSLVKLAITIASFVGAGFLAKTLSPVVADWCRPRIAKQIGQFFADQAAMPDFSGMDVSGLDSVDFTGLLEKFGFSGKELSNFAGGLLDSIKETGGSIADALAGSLANTIAYAIIYLIAFILIFLILWLITRPLKLAEKLPVVGGANRFGGAVLGIVEGAILIWIVAWVATKLQLLNHNLIAQTTLLRFFATGGPIKLFAQFYSR